MNVSVVIPTYNREKTIKRCIDSVINQTVSPLEIIVVDDGSTDSTISIVEEIVSDINIIIIKQGHKGAQAARNLGILNAKGDYIAFLDSDDEWLPQMLEEETKQLSQYRNNCIVYSDCYIYSNNKKRLWRLPECGSNAYSSLLMHPGPMFQSMLGKKELFLKIGLLDENVAAYQEWDTAIQLAKEAKFVHIKKPLFNYYFFHEGETLSKDLDKGVKGYGYIIRKYRKEIVRIHGTKGLKVCYENLFHLNYKNMRVILFIPEYILVNIVFIFKKVFCRHH